jgi:hypothetical protein
MRMREADILGATISSRADIVKVEYFVEYFADTFGA